MFQTTNLRSALETIKSVINPRSPSPIHACVRFEWGKSKKDTANLTLRAFGASVSVAHAIKVTSDDNGAFAVNASQLYDFLRALGANAEIECSYNADKSVARFRSGGYQVLLRTLPAEDFPEPPALKGTHVFDVNGETLYFALRRGSIARLDSNDEFLGASVAMHIDDGHLMIVSNDSNRVALANSIEVAGVPDGQFLMPPAAVNYLTSLDLKESTVRVEFNDRMAHFIIPDTHVYVSRVDGVMSVPTAALAKTFKKVVTVPYRDFQTAVNVVSVLMPGDDKTKVIELIVKDGKMTVKPIDMPDADVSSAVVECEANANLHLRLRPIQLKDYFSVASDEQLQIRTGGVVENANPLIVENAGKIVNIHTEKQDGFGYYVAPIERRNDKDEVAE